MCDDPLASEVNAEGIATMPPADPIEGIPDEDTVRRMLTDSIRRSTLLRSLLRVSRRKAAFDRPAGVAAQDRGARTGFQAAVAPNGGAA